MGDVEGDRFGDGKGGIVIPIKSLSFRVGIILLSIWLFVFIGYLETFGAKPIYFCGNPPIYCYFDQQSMVYAPKNMVRGWIKSIHKDEFNIDPFGGAKPRVLRRREEGPLRVNPEPLGLSSDRRRAQAFRPRSRRVDIGAKLGHRKWFSKSEGIPIILFVFIAVWGSAIIFVLGAILYRIVIEPGIKKRKLTREEDRQKQLSQNR